MYQRRFCNITVVSRAEGIFPESSLVSALPARPPRAARDSTQYRSGTAPTRAGYRGNSPNFCGGQYLKHALPNMFSFGNGPQMCESNELFRLSPITNTSPGGTICGSMTYVDGSSFSSFPRDASLTYSSPLFTSTLSPATATTLLMNTSFVSATDVLGSFHTKRRRGGVERRQLKLKGVEVGD